MPGPRHRALKSLLCLGSGGLAVSGCLLLAGPAAVAQPTSAQSGYWSQAPADPETPSGGTEIASNPSGPSAVAAYRFELPDGESADVLTLEVAFAQPASQVSLIACPVKASSADWQAPSGAGSFSNAPAADCTGGSVAGDVATDGSKVTFDLSTLDFGGSSVNIVVEPNTTPSPAPAGPSSAYPTFEVDFQPVSTQSLATTGTPAAGDSGSAAGTPSSDSSLGGVPGYQPAYGDFGAVPSSPPAVTVSPSALAPALASAPASDSSVPPAAASAAPVAPVAPVEQPGRLSTIAASGQSQWRWRIELALGMVLVDLFAYMWYQQRTGRSEEDRPPLSIYDPPPRSGEGVAGAGGIA